MYCANCGKSINEEEKYCATCGIELDKAPQEKKVDSISDDKNLLGFSRKINDPAFKKYVKNSNNYAVIFTMSLALIAVIGFAVAGERGWDNMENPQSIYIGMGIGGMFISIGLLQILGRKRSKTWDGVVQDKSTKRKTRKRGSGDDIRYKDYVEFKVIIQSEQGKIHEIIAEDDDTLYNYYQIGDKIRHHGGINSYEKYNKTGDSFILCNACGSLCDIKDEFCFRCKCPLLK